MPISLGPIASGLPKDIIEKMADAQREPIRQLEAKKANESARLALVDDLSKRISEISAGIKELNRFHQFRDLKAAVGRPELMDVTVDKTIAEPGNYNIEVMQLAGRSSMYSNAFPDPDETQVGVGYFNYALPDGTNKEVYIDAEHSSLNGIAELINKQKDLDLNAIVVNDGTGADESWRLLIAHKKSGEVNDAEFPDFYFLDGDQDFYMDMEHPAQNSVLKVNGFPVEFEGNKITTLLPGVTLDLKDAAPGKEFNLSITEDIESIQGKIKTFVDKMNEVLAFVQNQNSIDKDTNTTKTLGGDVTLQNLEFKIRNIIMNPIETEYGTVRMADLGVTFQRTGLLGLETEKLNKALQTNFDAVAEFFTGVDDNRTGFMDQIKTAVDGFNQPGGIVTARKEGIKNRIKDIDRQIEEKERQLSKQESALRDKFARLESTMAKLRSQQAYVQSSLGGGGGLLANLGAGNPGG